MLIKWLMSSRLVNFGGSNRHWHRTHFQIGDHFCHLEKKNEKFRENKKKLFFYKNLPEIIVFNEKMSFAHEPTLTKDNLEKTMKKKR